MIKDANKQNSSIDFETFKSIIKYRIKREGDIPFLISLYKEDDIRRYWNNGYELRALYLLALADYLSRIYNLPLATKYNDLRNYRMDSPVLPRDAILLDLLNNNSDASIDAIDNSIEEFIRYNIVECDIRDVT